MGSQQGWRVAGGRGGGRRRQGWGHWGRTGALQPGRGRRRNLGQGKGGSGSGGWPLSCCRATRAHPQFAALARGSAGAQSPHRTFRCRGRSGCPSTAQPPWGTGILCLSPGRCLALSLFVYEGTGWRPPSLHGGSGTPVIQQVRGWIIDTKGSTVHHHCPRTPRGAWRQGHT